MSGASDSFDQRAESTLVSIAVLIIPQFLRRAGSGSRHLPHAPRKKAGSARTYLTNGFSGARAGRMVVRSLSTTNSTRSPCFSPSRLQISRGTAIWPLLLIVLERVIFTPHLYSKNVTIYVRRGTAQESAQGTGAHKRSHARCVRPVVRNVRKLRVSYYIFWMG
jgi:hypothetical protein